MIDEGAIASSGDGNDRRVVVVSGYRLKRSDAGGECRIARWMTRERKDESKNDEQGGKTKCSRFSAVVGARLEWMRAPWGRA